MLPAYRRTHDVDLAVRERDFPEPTALLTEEGFARRRLLHLDRHTFKGGEPGELVVYMSSVGSVTVDEGTFQRSRTPDFGGTRVPTASLEDLLTLKLLAGRELDLADVAVLLHERRDGLDPNAPESLVGNEAMRRSAGIIPALPPEEYGWRARQNLKGWLRDRGWL